MTFTIMALSIIDIIVTLSLEGIMTFGITDLIVTLSIKDI